MNRLKDEKSPYLRQHASDPVEWYPWSEEAFSLASSLQRPVFLSIGYSSCHWCHVMQRESFKNPEVAEVLNRYFVCVKVDREERPDIDHIYMTYCHALTGRGGWPLNVLLTPEREPFYAFTYLPPEERHGVPGLKELLVKIWELWSRDASVVVREAKRIKAVLEQLTTPDSLKGDLSLKLVTRGVERFRRLYDPAFGGFGTAPKFPTPHNLLFLLAWYHVSGEPEVLQMVEHTLVRMALGGIYDHIGGGFHRYSTDQKWLLPHFEKMLYDQALLLYTYSTVYMITKNNLYERVVKRTIDFLKSEMASEEGAFYTALDADTGEREGGFYLWRKEEIIDLLGLERGELFCRVFNIKEEGNFREEATGILTGNNILYMGEPLQEVSRREGIPEARLRAFVDTCLEALHHKRNDRPRPFRDEKVLTDQNSLLIAGLLKAYRAFGEEEYLHTALRTKEFILKEMSDGARLYHCMVNGRRRGERFLDDYAYTVWALLELYESLFEPEDLRIARDLADEMLMVYGSDRGGLYLCTPDPSLPLRPIEGLDGALPSGNSVASLGLLKLSALTGEVSYRDAAEGILSAFSAQMEETPHGFPFMLYSLLYHLAGTPLLRISARTRKALKTTLKELYGSSQPLLSLSLKTGENKKALLSVSPALTELPLTDEPLFHVCLSGRCLPPQKGLGSAINMLSKELRKTLKISE